MMQEVQTVVDQVMTPIEYRGKGSRVCGVTLQPVVQHERERGEEAELDKEIFRQDRLFCPV